MTVHDDLSTLHGCARWIGDGRERSSYDAALSRVEAEVARLERESENYAGYGEILEELTTRAEAAEAEVARLRDGLQRIGYEMPTEERNPDGDEQAAHSMQLYARVLLADQDGAAHPKVYPANDWEHVTADCVACPGCAFTFDAFHVTQATGQYDCPVCGAQSRDGAA